MPLFKHSRTVPDLFKCLLEPTGIYKNQSIQNRIQLLTKIAAKLQQIQLTKQEQNIFNLLMQVVKEKSPSTILRVAGGWTRDKLLGKESHDIDISVNNMSGEKFAYLVKNYMDEHGIRSGKITVVKDNPKQSKHLATAMIKVLGLPIDFVNLRKETYADPTSRIPTTEPGTPEEDASRRDLTINALFYNINEDKIEDLIGGLKDLKESIARTPIDPVQTFLDDPLRILRTIRFATKYNLKVDPALITAARRPEVQQAFRQKVSVERIWQELAGQQEEEGWKIGFMTGPDPARAAQLLKETGLREILFELTQEELDKIPGLKEFGPAQEMISYDTEQKSPHHDLTIWGHTLKALEHLVKEETTPEQREATEDFLVRNMATLLHDIGKRYPGTQQITPQRISYQGHAKSSAAIAEYILMKLNAPKSVTQRVKKLIENHMDIHHLNENSSDKALRRFIKKLEYDWRNAIDMAMADRYGKKHVKEEQIQQLQMLKQRFIALVNEMGGHTKPKRPLTGHDIMQLGIPSGPLVGQALKALDSALESNPNMSREEAIKLIRSLNLNK